MALGALPRAVLRMVMWQGFVLAAWGCAFGLAAGFAVSRAMSGLFYGISGNSLLVLFGVPLLLAIVSLAACWVPARAVTAVDPVKALRHD
jgi:ABC-type antimicrobial peptide transport system permease subunit